MGNLHALVCLCEHDDLLDHRTAALHAAMHHYQTHIVRWMHVNGLGDFEMALRMLRRKGGRPRAKYSEMFQ